MTTSRYPYYSRWIRSHRDLPFRLNQWNNVVSNREAPKAGDFHMLMSPLDTLGPMGSEADDPFLASERVPLAGRPHVRHLDPILDSYD